MCFIVVSCIIWAVIVYELFKYMWLRRRCRELVIGEVLTYKVFNGAYYSEYYPVVRYKWCRATYTKMSRIGSSECPYTEGSSVEIWVNPLNGKDWYISEYFYKRVALLYIMVAINIAFTITGILALYGSVII